MVRELGMTFNKGLELNQGRCSYVACAAMLPILSLTYLNLPQPLCALCSEIAIAFQ